MHACDSQTQKLLDKYQALLKPERQLLQLLAFFMEPLSRTSFVQCLKNADLRLVPSRAISIQALTALLQKYQEDGLVQKIQNAYLCPKQLQQPLLRQLEIDGDFASFAAAVKPQISLSYYQTSLQCLQSLRLAIYLRDEAFVSRVLARYSNQFFHASLDNDPYALLFAEPLDQEWLLSLPINLLGSILFSLTYRSFATLLPSGAFEILEALVIKNPEAPVTLRCHHILHLILRGRLKQAEAAIATLPANVGNKLSGMLHLLRGDDSSAIRAFERELAQMKKTTGKRKVFVPGLTGVFHLLALVREGTMPQLKTAGELAAYAMKQKGYSDSYLHSLLYHLAETRSGNQTSKKLLAQSSIPHYGRLEAIEQLLDSLVAVWLKTASIPKHGKPLQRLIDDGKRCGFNWLAAEATLLRKKIDPRGKQDTAWAEQLFKEEGIVSLLGSSADNNDWERALKTLLTLGDAQPRKGQAPTKVSRLIWLISGDDDQLFIQPMEQKQKVRGWTKGRKVGLKRLAESSATLDFLTLQDRKVVACICKERSYGYYSPMIYEIDIHKAMGALIDHPLVFNADHKEEPLSVARGEFSLEVIRGEEHLRMTMTPLPEFENAGFWCWEGPSRLLLYEPTLEQRRIASIIGEGLSIPKAGEKQITAAITAISPHLIVHSDLAGENGAAKTIAADNRLQILLRPSGTGVSVELRMRPFGEVGPRFFPGRGGATVITEVQGEKRQCRRNHALELERFEGLLQSCNIFDLYPCQDDFWRIEEPYAALELLEQLQTAIAAAPDAYLLQWPEGERFKLRGTASWGQMKLSVRSDKDWFALEGQVSIAEDEVLSLQQLLALVQSSKSRFVQLAEGEFVALTDEFRRRLDDLLRVVDQRSKKPRFHPLAAPLVDEALAGSGIIKGDKQWKATLERFRAAEALQPSVPATLQASLRDYQIEGFEWLSRLAHWGVGACLADDMGLGKTVQALALLINRAPAGPALVLAPTSVCLNWESETRRFAPTLQPRLFGAGNRKEFVASLQPFDLVICSYSLFQQEAELLTAIPWETAVLDEAQAIKNMTTKRSQAAMQLQANFRIATTGTPMENRLEELWNLFRFLNPGLLGAHKSFNERFAIPIERDQDKNARILLKKLIRPFILRRIKSQVLEELPPRTDIIHRVELSGAEAAFYEALRRQALDNLHGTDEQRSGERQIRILAEIMRLRRACCNPQLVMPESDIPSAKLAAFREIVAELRKNGHRALVFSQFVGHLALLCKALDKDGIGYQYLDGSTPTKQRQESVTAFQSGQGELFLISLKAGGVGLNLTAADYVIHMDPWWNPAVEDQASDRAHRIGQQRPVTVYRLVAANTIEEKIVALHGQKRDLADSLLDGTETAARVSADELLELLREVE